MAEQGPSGFGERVRQRREALRLSQAQLAEEAGLDPMTINRIESGEQRGATTDTAKKLAKALLCGLDWLLRPFEDEEDWPAGVAVLGG